MKKLLFGILLLIAACSTEPEEIKGPPPGANLHDPGCHGGEWFSNTNLASITPWTYGEWMTMTIKAQIPVYGLGGMGPVIIKYRISNSSGAAVSPTWILPTYVTAQGGAFGAGGYKDITVTVPSCIAQDGWVEFPIQMKFTKGPGTAPTQLGGSLLSVDASAGCSLPNLYPSCTEHKKANHDQGWVWTLQNP
ncbi:MAG TPA: hypothetical protein VK589_16580 [Chryseolinea sp.]|nr:hypothetical protein [Chryseolinea sp.]